MTGYDRYLEPPDDPPFVEIESIEELRALIASLEDSASDPESGLSLRGRRRIEATLREARMELEFRLREQDDGK